MDSTQSRKQSTASSAREPSALLDREAYYRSLLSNIADVLVVLEESGAIRDCSPSVTRHFGWDPADLIGTDGLALIHADDRANIAKTLVTLLAEPETEVTEPCRIRRADGSYSPVEISGVNLVGDPRIKGLVVNVRARLSVPGSPLDLFDAPHPDEQSAGALELMAGGIAHDLNNILAGLVSYPELILLELPSESALREPVEAVLESGQRAAAMVADLVTLGRGVTAEPEPLDLNELVKESLASPEFACLAETHPHIAYTLSLAENLPPVEAPRRAIAQAILGLIANAFGGAKQGGRVTITSGLLSLPTPPRGFESIAPGEYAAVSVADSGAPLSQREAERLLEPFYAKRVLGRGGYGLSLALAREAVRAARGAIAIRSSANGNTLDLCLPPLVEEP